MEKVALELCSTDTIVSRFFNQNSYGLTLCSSCSTGHGTTPQRRISMPLILQAEKPMTYLYQGF